MAIKSVLSIGDKVVLSRINKDGEEKKYYSRVVDFVDTSKIKIEMPMENAMYIPLKVGREYTTTFQTKASMYRCRLKIHERVKESGKYYLVAKYISELEKIQRREFYRLECISDIDFCVCKDINDKEKSTWEKAIMIDLSGGGMKFNSKIAVDKEKTIKIRFPINVDNEKEYLICMAKIMYVAPISNQKFEYRVNFEELDSYVREKIIKHIFDEERRRRNRS